MPGAGDKRRICLIGGGWSNLQTLLSLKAMGVTEVTLFEKNKYVGGTWGVQSENYPDLETHAPAWLCQFSNFPFSDSKDVLRANVPAKEMHRYINAFCDANNLWPHIRLNSAVASVKYDTASRTGQVVLADGSVAGPFDLILYGSVASAPKMPKKFVNSPFKGKVVHSSWVREDLLDEITRRGLKVGIIGGSKSGADMNSHFIKRGYDDAKVNWVYRVPYFFVHRERGHLHHQSLQHQLHVLLALLGLLLYRFTPILATWWFNVTGFTWRMPATRPENPKRVWNTKYSRPFHWGTMKKSQREELVAHRRPHEGEIEGLDADGIVMADGRRIACDVIILATGHLSGIERLTLEKDGQAVAFDNAKGMFEHLIIPDFPILAVGGTGAWFNFGPTRGVTQAEWMVHHLKRAGTLSDADIQKQVARQRHLGSPGFLAGLGVADGEKGTGNDADGFNQGWLKFWEDYMRLGYTDMIKFTLFGLEFFGLNRMTYPQFTFSPKQHPVGEQLPAWGGADELLADEEPPYGCLSEGWTYVQNGGIHPTFAKKVVLMVVALVLGPLSLVPNLALILLYVLALLVMVAWGKCCGRRPAATTVAEKKAGGAVVIQAT